MISIIGLAMKNKFDIFSPSIPSALSLAENSSLFAQSKSL